MYQQSKNWPKSSKIEAPNINPFQIIQFLNNLQLKKTITLSFERGNPLDLETWGIKSPKISDATITKVCNNFPQIDKESLRQALDQSYGQLLAAFFKKEELEEELGLRACYENSNPKIITIAESKIPAHLSFGLEQLVQQVMEIEQRFGEINSGEEEILLELFGNVFYYLSFSPLAVQQKTSRRQHGNNSNSNSLLAKIKENLGERRAEVLNDSLEQIQQEASILLGKINGFLTNGESLNVEHFIKKYFIEPSSAKNLLQKITKYFENDELMSKLITSSSFSSLSSNNKMQNFFDKVIAFTNADAPEVEVQKTPQFTLQILTKEELKPEQEIKILRKIQSIDYSSFKKLLEQSSEQTTQLSQEIDTKPISQESSESIIQLIRQNYTDLTTTEKYELEGVLQKSYLYIKNLILNTALSELEIDPSHWKTMQVAFLESKTQEILTKIVTEFITKLNNYLYISGLLVLLVLLRDIPLYLVSDIITLRKVAIEHSPKSKKEKTEISLNKLKKEIYNKFPKVELPKVQPDSIENKALRTEIGEIGEIREILSDRRLLVENYTSNIERAEIFLAVINILDPNIVNLDNGEIRQFIVRLSLYLNKNWSGYNNPSSIVASYGKLSPKEFEDFIKKGFEDFKKYSEQIAKNINPHFTVNSVEKEPLAV